MTKILLVDDDRHVRVALARALEVHGHEVDEADNGALALERLRELHGDIVVADLVMPEMDGLELIRAIRGQRRSTRIIAMSGGCFGETSYLKAAGAFGADFTIAKPFSVAQLVEAIDRLTGQVPSTPTGLEAATI